MISDLSSLFECLDSKNCTSIDVKILNALGILPDKLPFLKLTTTPTNITCSGCEEYCHNMPVHKDGSQAYIVCDKVQQYGKIILKNEYLQNWRLDLSELARFISSVLDKGNITELVSQRIYDLGVIGGKTLFLVKGIAWHDAQEVLKDRRILIGNAVFITLSPAPEWLENPSLWIGQLLVANDSEVVVDRERLASIIPNITLSGSIIIEDRYRQERSKGGKQRHNKTNIIKNNIIRPLLENRKFTKGITTRQQAKKIHEHLTRLNEWGEGQIIDFATKYDLDETLLKQSIPYFSEDKEEQVYKWCLAVKKENL
jgi:hypothetical protein